LLPDAKHGFMDICLTPVRQQVNSTQVPDVPAAVHAGLRALPLHERVKPGMRIAIGVGSRGISCLYDVVMALGSALRELGAEPFLVPAMGSHGGGTPEGQRAVLESYGLADGPLGLPIHSDLDVIQAGTAPDGMPVFFSGTAARSDGIIVVNRVKEHTAFKGRWESGLMKMLSVGLGKARGAAEIHNWGIREAMPAAARVILETMPVLAGIAIVENGYHQPAEITVLPAGEIEAAEPELLNRARSLTPRIPFEPLHLLVVGEMGKEISGTGMDLNVIGMWRRTGGPGDPHIYVIAVLDLTAASHGNALGVGHGDLITRRLYDKINRDATYLNCLTSHNLAGGKIPIVMPNDREAIRAGLAGVPLETARMLLIRNTLELELMWASPALLPEVERSPALSVAGPSRRLTFSAGGDLDWSAL